MDQWTEARYAFAARWARGKRVLLASGPEQGREQLARVCRDLVEDGPADLVVALHVEGWERRLDQWRQALVEPGELLVSVPGCDEESLRTLLAGRFPHLRVFAEVHLEAVVSTLPEVLQIAGFVECPVPEAAATAGLVAVCSSRPLPPSPPFVHLPADQNVLCQREQHITLLHAELQQKNQWLAEAHDNLAALGRAHQDLQTAAQENSRRAEEALRDLETESAAKTTWGRELETEVARLQSLWAGLQAEFQDRTAWALRLDAERTALLERGQGLEAEVSRLEAELGRAVAQLGATERALDERTAWAQALDAEVQQLREQVQALLGSAAYRIGRHLGLTPSKD